MHHLKQSRNSNAPEFEISAAAKSARGPRSEVNEDCFRIDEQRGIFVVADGLGGQFGGGLASRLVTRELVQEARCIVSKDSHGDNLSDAMQAAFLRVNNGVLDVAKHLPHFRGMGASAAMAIVANGRLYVESAGDCRAYLLRDDQAERLTVDQSLFQLLVNAGLAHDVQQTARSRRLLWSCLGAGKCEVPQVRSVEIQPADRLVLVTNGITRVLKDGLLGRLGATSEDASATASNMVNAALTLRTQDDATCVAVSFDSAISGD